MFHTSEIPSPFHNSVSFFLIPQQINPSNQSCRLIQKPNQNQEKTNLRTQKELNTYILRNSERLTSVFRATHSSSIASSGLTSMWIPPLCPIFPHPFPFFPNNFYPQIPTFSSFSFFFPRIQSWNLFSNSMSGKNGLLGRELDFDRGKRDDMIRGGKGSDKERWERERIKKLDT